MLKENFLPFQDVRGKVVSVTRECCHYFNSSQGNMVALIKQMNTNFQVSTYFFLFILFFILFLLL